MTAKGYFPEYPLSILFFKGYGPDIVHLSYDKRIELPQSIREKIPPPPPRARSIWGKLKERIFGYNWEVE